MPGTVKTLGDCGGADLRQIDLRELDLLIAHRQQARMIGSGAAGFGGRCVLVWRPDPDGPLNGRREPRRERENRGPGRERENDDG